MTCLDVRVLLHRQMSEGADVKSYRSSSGRGIEARLTEASVRRLTDFSCHRDTSAEVRQTMAHCAALLD
jgi:hypothetical protein